LYIDFYVCHYSDIKNIVLYEIGPFKHRLEYGPEKIFKKLNLYYI
jgi:hypothetical protein